MRTRKRFLRRVRVRSFISLWKPSQELLILETLSTSVLTRPKRPQEFFGRCTWQHVPKGYSIYYQLISSSNSKEKPLKSNKSPFLSLTEIVKLCKMFIPSVDMNAVHDVGEQRCRLFHRRSPVTKTLQEEWRFSVVEILRFRHRIAMNWNNWRENSRFYVCPSSKCLGLTLGFCSTPSNFCKSESILASSSFRL